MRNILTSFLLAVAIAPACALLAGHEAPRAHADIISVNASPLLDQLGFSQGDTLYRGPNGWTTLPPGTSGQAFLSGGANGNPSWGSAGGGPAASAAQVVYVNDAGNDSTGDGSSGKPYLTVSQAETSITDASATKPYIISVGPGVFSNNLVLKSFVKIQGAGSTPGSSFGPNSTISGTSLGCTKITGTLSVADASWTASQPWAELDDVDYLNASSTLDLTAQSTGNYPTLTFRRVCFDRTTAATLAFIDGVNHNGFLVFDGCELDADLANLDGFTTTFMNCGLTNGNVFVVPTAPRTSTVYVHGCRIATTWQCNGTVTIRGGACSFTGGSQIQSTGGTLTVTADATFAGQCVASGGTLNLTEMAAGVSAVNFGSDALGDSAGSLTWRGNTIATGSGVAATTTSALSVTGGFYNQLIFSDTCNADGASDPLPSQVNPNGSVAAGFLTTDNTNRCRLIGKSGATDGVEYGFYYVRTTLNGWEPQTILVDWAPIDSYTDTTGGKFHVQCYDVTNGHKIAEEYVFNGIHALGYYDNNDALQNVGVATTDTTYNFMHYVFTVAPGNNNWGMTLTGQILSFGTFSYASPGWHKTGMSQGANVRFASPGDTLEWRIESGNQRALQGIYVVRGSVMLQ